MSFEDLKKNPEKQSLKAFLILPKDPKPQLFLPLPYNQE
jgi:hypothetical protein